MFSKLWITSINWSAACAWSGSLVFIQNINHRRTENIKFLFRFCRWTPSQHSAVLSCSFISRKVFSHLSIRAVCKLRGLLFSVLLYRAVLWIFQRSPALLFAMSAVNIPEKKNGIICFYTVKRDQLFVNLRLIFQIHWRQAIACLTCIQMNFLNQFNSACIHSTQFRNNSSQ